MWKKIRKLHYTWKIIKVLISISVFPMAFSLFVIHSPVNKMPVASWSSPTMEWSVGSSFTIRYLWNVHVGYSRTQKYKLQVSMTKMHTQIRLFASLLHNIFFLSVYTHLCSVFVSEFRSILLNLSGNKSEIRSECICISISCEDCWKSHSFCIRGNGHFFLYPFIQKSKNALPCRGIIIFFISIRNSSVSINLKGVYAYLLMR